MYIDPNSAFPLIYKKVWRHLQFQVTMNPLNETFINDWFKLKVFIDFMNLTAETKTNSTFNYFDTY